MSSSPPQHGERGETTKTARSNSRSRVRSSGENSGRTQRIPIRQSDVEHLKDMRPVLLDWLRSKDAFFSPIETATGLDREQVNNILNYF
jgi:hypothetical protein